jgi:hypothetical protein
MKPSTSLHSIIYYNMIFLFICFVLWKKTSVKSMCDSFKALHNCPHNVPNRASWGVFICLLFILPQIRCIVGYALKALPNFKIYNNGKAPKAKGFPKIKGLGCQVQPRMLCNTKPQGRGIPKVRTLGQAPSQVMHYIFVNVGHLCTLATNKGWDKTLSWDLHSWGGRCGRDFAHII